MGRLMAKSKKAPDTDSEPVRFGYRFCMDQLNESVNADAQMRERVREAHLFVDERQGQWEPSWWTITNNKPRYTFDKTSPVINNISGAIKRAEFGIKVDPINEATKEDADKIAGIIRHIQEQSDAVLKVFNPAVKNVITGGLDFWEVVQDYSDGDSFEQDLLIKKISNAHDRAWLDANSEQQDGSDARWGWKFTALTTDAYEQEYPEGSKVSVNLPTEINNTFFDRKDVIIIGTFYYLKAEKRTLLMFDNGKILEKNDENKQVIDDIQKAGFKVTRERTREKFTCYRREFDGKEWLGDEEKTVFSYVPLVPEYGNFKIIDNKILYHGIVEKLMDPQRVLNYSLSREVEEGALAPRKKMMMTEEQAEGNWATLKTMNVNMEPVQVYTHVDGQVQPYETGGPQINAGLRVISESMVGMMGDFAGQFAASRGDEVKAQSGVAISRLQDKSDITNVDYVESHEISICHTARILTDAIPKVYKDRKVRILKDDDSFEIVDLGETVIDEETGKPVKVIDLAAGKFSVSCSAGPTFKTKQQETVYGIAEIAKLDPTIIQDGADVLLNAMDAPGMSLLADRKRKQLFEAGRIPVEQMSEEEKVQFAAAQQSSQGQQMDGETMLGMAELTRAQTEQAEAQVATQEKGVKAQVALRDQDLKEQKFQFEQMMAMQQKGMEQIQSLADLLKTIREGMGVQAIPAPAAAEAFIKTAQQLNYTIDPRTRKPVLVQG